MLSLKIEYTVKRQKNIDKLDTYFNKTTVNNNLNIPFVNL